MAKFSEQFLGSLRQPSYREGLFEAVKGAMQTPEIMRVQKETEEAKDLYEKTLAQHSLDPVELRRQGMIMRASTNEAIRRQGDLLLQEADRAQGVLDRQAEETTGRVETARARYDAVREAREETDIAFDEARTFRRTLKDARDRVLNEDGSPKKGATEKEKRLYRALQTRSITAEEYAEEMLKEQEVSVTYKKLVDTDGIEKEFKIINNAVTGQEISREPLGPVAPNQYKSPLETAKGMEIVASTREAMQQAGSDAATLESAAAFAQNRSATERGALGTVFSGMKEFAGVGTEVEFHRAQLREIRMQGVLGMLPPGVASDRDVQLAMDASVDFNSLDNPTAASYLRGMAKIKRAQQKYESEKLRWIRETEDPNALGFDDYVAYKDAKNRESEFHTGQASRDFLLQLQAARALPEPQQTEQMKILRTTFGDELDELDEIDRAIKNWENYDEKPEGFKDV